MEWILTPPLVAVIPVAIHRAGLGGEPHPDDACNVRFRNHNNIGWIVRMATHVCADTK